MDKERIIALAERYDRLAHFADTPVPFIRKYGTEREREYLAFVYCYFMTGLPSDTDDIRTLTELRCLRVLHEYILNTRSLERAALANQRIYDSFVSGFYRTFVNFGVGEVLTDKEEDPQERLCTFLRLMVRSSEVDLGIWRKVSPDQITVPVNSDIVEAAVKLGVISMGAANACTRDAITQKMREIFPGDPARGWYALYGWLKENE
jgi:uncharacterized protein (TIGR02757 family)